jgi:hypothetical protein
LLISSIKNPSPITPYNYFSHTPDGLNCEVLLPQGCFNMMTVLLINHCL